MLPPTQRRFEPQRGSALLLAVVLIAILAVIGLAVIGRASSEVDATMAKRHYDKSISCADAAKELLMSQFQIGGTSPTEITPFNIRLDDRNLAMGHYDQVAVQSVSVASGVASTALGMSDISNRVSTGAMGGKTYRLTVVCSRGSSGDGGTARASEVEFLVRFGI
ncbi:MAG: hypothetical protein ACT4TC_17550 [Myxococcaceae bacterium]